MVKHFGTFLEVRLETGEDFTTCLSRELKEELPNIDQFQIGELLGVRKRQEAITDGTEIVFIYFQVKTQLDQVKLSSEHTDFQWATVTDLSRLSPPINQLYTNLLQKAIHTTF